jgi:hypothetical protein
VRDPTPGIAFARQLVVGAERASGVELSGRKLAGRITGSAGYSLSVARTSAAGLTFPSSQDRRHSLDVTVLTRLTPSVHAGAAYTFASGAPYTRIRSTSEQDSVGNWHMTPAQAEEPNANRMRAHANLDLLLEWTLGAASTRWTLFFQVRNALNRENPLVFLMHYECGPEAPFAYMCGDQFNAGVRRIPVVGLRATF